MDPLDPLTEIIRSGQGFSSSIALERILWVIMGFFFLGAFLTSITGGMKQKNWLGNNSFLTSLKLLKKNKISNKLSNHDK